jgi:membrane-associated phospholipid phosphatase
VEPGVAAGAGRRIALGVILGALAATLTLMLLAWAFGAAALRLDEAVLHAVASRRTGVWDRMALQATALGNVTTLAVLVFWASVLFWAAGRRLAVVGLVVASVGGRLLNEGLKLLFDRARPEILEWGAPVTSASFPSAHAMSGAIVYGALAYLVAEAPGPGSSAARRVAIWSVTIVIVLAIATSRVLLGVHYPSDAAAGILAGAIWTAIVLTTLRFGGRRPDR